MIANFAAVDIRPGSMGRPLPGIDVAIVRHTGEETIEVVETPDTEIVNNAATIRHMSGGQFSSSSNIRPCTTWSGPLPDGAGHCRPRWKV